MDTGSVDETRDIIHGILSEVPGELHQQPWTDFATARNYALELARSRADRLLFLDADDVVSARNVLLVRASQTKARIQPAVEPAGHQVLSIMPNWSLLACTGACV